VGKKAIKPTETTGPCALSGRETKVGPIRQEGRGRSAILCQGRTRGLRKKDDPIKRESAHLRLSSERHSPVGTRSQTDKDLHYVHCEGSTKGKSGGEKASMKPATGRCLGAQSPSSSKPAGGKEGRRWEEVKPRKTGGG